MFAFDIQSRIIHGLTVHIPLIGHLPAKTNRDILQSRTIILNKASSIIKEKQIQAQQSTARPKDIIGLIVRDNMKSSGADTLSFEAMRDQVMTFLGAG